jgi:hypothetical protein
MSLVLASLFALSSIVALVSNRDLFSPAKLYLLNFAVFFGAAFIHDLSPGTAGLCLLVVSFGTLAALFERTPPRIRSGNVESCVLYGHRRAVATIWALTIGPLAAFVYLVIHAGGFWSFVAKSGGRTVEWRGLGWAVTLMLGIGVLNLSYLAVGLLGRRNRRWWIAFAVHGLITVSVLGISGSRSAILSHLVIMAMLFNYLHRRLTIVAAAFAAASLLFAALFLGSLREQIYGIMSEGTGEISEAWSLKQDSFSYGTTALERILHMDPRTLAHGTTFLSLFTNAVPRGWWPSKPDSGGIFLTKHYFDDAWDGASNVTPTFLGEWIINFGLPLGTVGFVIAQALILRLLSVRYTRTCGGLGGPRTVDMALRIVLYLCLLWALVGLMVGEVTNTLLLFMLTRVAPIAAIRLGSRLDLRRSRPAWHQRSRTRILAEALGFPPAS